MRYAILFLLLLAGCAGAPPAPDNHYAELLQLREKVETLQERIDRIDQEPTFDHIQRKLQEAFSNLKEARDKLNREELRLRALKENESQ